MKYICINRSLAGTARLQKYVDPSQVLLNWKIIYYLRIYRYIKYCHRLLFAISNVLEFSISVCRLDKLSKFLFDLSLMNFTCICFDCKLAPCKNKSLGLHPFLFEFPAGTKVPAIYFFACSATGITPTLCWGMYGEEAWTEACFRSVAFFAFAGEQGAKGFLNVPVLLYCYTLYDCALARLFYPAANYWGFLDWYDSFA